MFCHLFLFHNCSVEGGELFDRVVSVTRFEEPTAKLLFYQMLVAVKVSWKLTLLYFKLKGFKWFGERGERSLKDVVEAVAFVTGGFVGVWWSTTKLQKQVSKPQEDENERRMRTIGGGRFLPPTSPFFL